MLPAVPSDFDDNKELSPGFVVTLSLVLVVLAFATVGYIVFM